MKLLIAIPCMDTVPAFLQGITHVLCNLIHPCLNRSDETASGHYDINRIEFNSIFRQEIHNGVTAHITLIHHRFILGNLLSRMSEVHLKLLLSVFVESDLC